MTYSFPPALTGFSPRMLHVVYRLNLFGGKHAQQGGPGGPGGPGPGGFGRPGGPGRPGGNRPGGGFGGPRRF